MPLMILIFIVLGCQNPEDENLEIYGKWQSISWNTYNGASDSGPWFEDDDEEDISMRWVIEIEPETFTLIGIMEFMGTEYADTTIMACTITESQISLAGTDEHFYYTLENDILTLESIHYDEEEERWHKTVTVLEMGA